MMFYPKQAYPDLWLTYQFTNDSDTLSTATSFNMLEKIAVEIFKRIFNREMLHSQEETELLH